MSSKQSKKNEILTALEELVECLENTMEEFRKNKKWVAFDDDLFSEVKEGIEDSLMNLIAIKP
jgi:hypothetical protein